MGYAQTRPPDQDQFAEMPNRRSSATRPMQKRICLRQLIRRLVCAHVDAVKNIVASETTSTSTGTIERRSKWSLAEADRIDSVRKAHLLFGRSDRGTALAAGGGLRRATPATAR